MPNRGVTVERYVGEAMPLWPALGWVIISNRGKDDFRITIRYSDRPPFRPAVCRPQCDNAKQRNNWTIKMGLMMLNKEKYKKKAIDKKLVLDTWRKILQNEDRL